MEHKEGQISVPGKSSSSGQLQSRKGGSKLKGSKSSSRNTKLVAGISTSNIVQKSTKRKVGSKQSVKNQSNEADQVKSLSMVPKEATKSASGPRYIASSVTVNKSQSSRSKSGTPSRSRSHPSSRASPKRQKEPPTDLLADSLELLNRMKDRGLPIEKTDVDKTIQSDQHAEAPAIKMVSSKTTAVKASTLSKEESVKQKKKSRVKLKAGKSRSRVKKGTNKPKGKKQKKKRKIPTMSKALRRKLKLPILSAAGLGLVNRDSVQIGYYECHNAQSFMKYIKMKWPNKKKKGKRKKS